MAYLVFPPHSWYKRILDIVWKDRVLRKRRGHTLMVQPKLTSVLIAWYHNLMLYTFCFHSTLSQKDGKYISLVLCYNGDHSFIFNIYSGSLRNWGKANSFPKNCVNTELNAANTLCFPSLSIHCKKKDTLTKCFSYWLSLWRLSRRYWIWNCLFWVWLPIWNFLRLSV